MLDAELVLRKMGLIEVDDSEQAWPLRLLGQELVRMWTKVEPEEGGSKATTRPLVSCHHRSAAVSPPSPNGPLTSSPVPLAV